MNIVLLGSGNVATVLGKKFIQAGHPISQIYSRNYETASELAYEFNCDSTNYYSTINPSADLYIITVPDKAIPEVAGNLKVKNTVVHTAASVSMEVLKVCSSKYGVLYPLQTISTKSVVEIEIPFFVDGSDDHVKQQLQNLVTSITNKMPPTLGDEDRSKLHLAAVLVNNFVNHLYVLTEKYCKEEGIDFAILYPIISETAAKITSLPPAEAQTGPAIRNDYDTIQKHEVMLSKHPELKKMYTFFTESLLNNK